MIISSPFKHRWHLFKQWFTLWPFYLKNRFSKSELWALDLTLSKYALPRLMAFRNTKRKFPKDVLDKIIRAHQLVVHYDGSPMHENEMEEVEEGMLLFGEHYLDLWS